jgi:tetratricopeptide (TPR) repeat protein
MGALKTFLVQGVTISSLKRAFGFLAGKHMSLSGRECVHFSFPSLFHRNLLSFSFLFLLTFCSFQLLTTTSLWAAGLKVNTEASEKRGFARLVLNFERLPAYESDVDDTILVFKFKEAVDLNLDDLIRKMPNYVSVARVDPDGHAFRLAFSDSFKVNIMEAGSQIFIDILGRQWKGMPPNLPQDVLRAIAKRAAEIEAENQERLKQKKKAKELYTARIRVGALPTFTRFVFDWNKFVTSKMERRGDLVQVTFGQSVKLDVGRVKHDLPKNLLDISSVTTETSTIVTLKLPPQSNVRGYREGEDYVVDVSPSDVALSKQLNELKNKVVDDEGNVVGREDVQLLSSEAPKKMDEFSGEQETISMVRSTYSDFNPDKFDLSMYGDGADQVGLPAVKSKAGEIFVPAQIQSQQREDKALPALSPERTAAGDYKSVYIKETPDHSEIFFRFDEAVAAAGFIRGETVWIVFDSFKPLDLSGVMKKGGKYIKDIRKVRLNNGQLILIKLAEPQLFALEYDNFIWTAKIGEMVSAKAKSLRLRRQVNAENKRYVSIPLQQPSHIYWLKDETIGDRIGLVTSYPPVEQLMKPQDLVEFHAFGTAQGVAITPKTDDVEVRVGFQEVVITRHSGLHLSDDTIVTQTKRPEKIKRNKKSKTGYINFDEWRSAGNGSFVDQMGSFETKIAISENEERVKARRDYARFLIANELAPEALGMLERLRFEYPEKQNEAEIRVLQAAANVMMRRPKDAIAALAVSDLHSNEHASLWRGMAKNMLEQWSDAMRQFRNGQDVIRAYPDLQRARFSLAAAKAAKNLQNYALMKEYLRSVPMESGIDAVDAEAMLLNAQYLANMGEIDDALNLFNLVAKSDVAPIAAQAKVDILKLKLDNQMTSMDQAISDLEGMQLMWRGDATEVQMLSMLSNLYANKGEYRLAFGNMKQAVKAFPTDDSALRIQDDMKKVFKSLYLQNIKTNLRPIESLSLFYDFKELTPVGRSGDEMIRMLADRLIDVDLLDHAAELLDHQVNKRVHGAARSQVAAKLAMVHLMNRKPILALQTIGRTRQPNLPERVKRARDVLEARSLSEMGRVDGAIDILNRMKGAEIERMKADAYWNARQWGKSGEQLEKLLGTSWNRSDILQPYERKDVLRAAISYSLAEDAFALSRLRKKFYNKMVNSEDASAFIVVTKPVNKNGEVYKKLAKDIAAINTLDVFMKQYRDHYKDSLSAGRVARGQSEQEG